MKKLSLLLLVLLLASCASMQYGNFTQIPQSTEVCLAEDAVSQLVRVYPPALNNFYINQKVQDDFGIHLMLAMRKKGYGLFEHVSKQQANFFYVLDALEESHLYRVSLYIGTQSLSRVYEKTNDKLVPISSWTHKE